MYYIEDEDGDLVNMMQMNCVYINDKVPEYSERYRVMTDNKDYEFVLSRFKEEKDAKAFVKALHEKMMGIG